MMSLRSRRGPIAVLTVLGGLLLGAACDDDPVANETYLLVSTSTTGAAFDPNGYVVLIDGAPAPGRLDLTDALPVVPDGRGAVELELTDVAANCAVAGERRRTVDLAAGDVTEVAFEVHCTAPVELASLRLIFVRVRPDGQQHLYEMRADGTGVVAFTNDGMSYDPAVSRDGESIAYVHASTSWMTEIRVLGPGGQDLGAITDEYYVASPSWAPDGTRIVYESGDGYWTGEIRVRDLSGGDPVVFPTPGFDGTPSWSPDGSRIAFSRWSEAGFGLYTMSPEGTDVTRLKAGAWDPVWSPTSDRIAFRAEGDAYVLSIDDGVWPDRVLSGGETGWEPTGWSPDGNWIVLTGWKAYQGDAFYESDVFLLHTGDGTLLRVTTDGQSHSAVAATMP